MKLLLLLKWLTKNTWKWTAEHKASPLLKIQQLSSSRPSLSLSHSLPMQRQSLGSPVSKFYSHGGAAKDDALTAADDSRHRDLISSSLSGYDDDDEEHRKSSKLVRRFSSSSPSFSLSSTPPNPEKLVHFIPLLTLLCFLVLYLVSHNPSQSGKIPNQRSRLPPLIS